MNYNENSWLELRWFCRSMRVAIMSVEPMAYTVVYVASLESAVQRKAKIFMNNRSQAVRLPKEFQFNTSEVFIRKEGKDVILSPRPQDWSAYLASGPVASKEFMEGIEDLPAQERDH